MFRQFRWVNEYVEQQLWNYAYLNAGLRINFNGKTFFSKNGLLDLHRLHSSRHTIHYPTGKRGSPRQPTANNTIPS